MSTASVAPARPPARRYTVILADGEVVDRDLHPLAPAVVASCGHDHWTPEAAERCLTALRHRHCDWCGARTPFGSCRVGGGGHSMVASARWYNARIHGHAPGSMAYRPTAEAEA